MNLTEILETYLNLMAAAWWILLRPRLQLRTSARSFTLDHRIGDISWSLAEANILTIFAVLGLLLPSQVNRLKWLFVCTYWFQCFRACCGSTGHSLVELLTSPSMLAADNYVPIHLKMIILFGMQLFVLIELASFLVCELMFGFHTRSNENKAI